MKEAEEEVAEKREKQFKRGEHSGREQESNLHSGRELPVEPLYTFPSNGLWALLLYVLSMTRD